MSGRPAAQNALAAQLRKLRLRAGLTQEALAEKAGVSVATIGAIEEGQRRRPYPNTLRALADSLELSAADRAALLAPAPPRTDDAEDDVSRALRVAVPVPPSALIGREPEIATARALLLPPANTRAVRLLTLLGPGGVGKTRLSLEIVSNVRQSYADGAVFVDLAPIHDHRLVTELLGACPDLTVLVTSRTALRVRSEQRLAIGPLPTPAADQRPPLTEVAAYPAVRLFVDRVREVTPRFSLEENNCATVAEICRRLDGIPLALELAAARTQLLTPVGPLKPRPRSAPAPICPRPTSCIGSAC